MSKWTVEMWDTSGVLLSVRHYDTLEEAVGRKYQREEFDRNADHIYVIKKENENETDVEKPVGNVEKSGY